MTIAILTLNYDSFSNPTLQTIFEEFEKSDINEILFYSLLKQDKEIENLYSKVKHVQLKGSSFRHILKLLFNLSLTKRYSLFLIDPSTIPYILIAIILRVKVTYLSFEIFFPDEASKDKNWPEKFKNIIQFKYWNFLLEKVDSFLIQDKTRLSLTNLKLNHKNIYFCPVSPSEVHQNIKTSQDLKKFGIIYSGSISQWSGINMLLEAVKDPSWPPEASLCLHSKFSSIDKQLESEILTLVEQGYKITLDLNPINDFEEYLKYLSKFHIGLSFYFPTYDSLYNGKNITYLGLSSGKSNAYLSQGIPFISTQNNEYEKLNTNNKFCYLLDKNDSKEVLEGLLKIINDYEAYSTNASKIFTEHIAPNTTIRSLIKNVNKARK